MNFEENLAGRKLGHEWYGWDGNIDAHEAFIEEPKRLFLGMVAFTFALLFATASLLVWGFYPRLIELHPYVATVAMVALVLFAGVFVGWYGSVVAALWFKRPLKASEQVGMQFVKMFPIFASVAKRCGISQDRLGYSLIEIHNQITRDRLRESSNGRILVLSPRCLDRETADQIRAMSSEYDCDFYMAPTGAQARQKVSQLRPGAIIGIACERDLISGIRDVGYHFPVIGITNKRPLGPCKGAFIDMTELRESIGMFQSRYDLDRASTESIVEEPHEMVSVK